MQKRKIISVILAVAMICTTFSITAFAAPETSEAVLTEAIMTASPFQLTEGSNINQTFTLSICNASLTGTLQGTHITLGGDLAGLQADRISRIDSNTFSLRLRGTLVKNTGLGSITVDSSALVGAEGPVTAKVFVEKSVPSKTRVSVHDPSIMKDHQDGYYYIFGTSLGRARSTNLMNWSSFGSSTALFGGSLNNDNLDVNPLGGTFKWAGYKEPPNATNGYAVWAAQVIYNPHYVNEYGSKGAYMYFYSTSSNYKRNAIGFAVSKNIAEGYKYVDTILYSGFTPDDAYDTGGWVNTNYRNTHIDELIAEGKISGLNEKWFDENGGYNIVEYPGTIDPGVFFDKDGRMWMTYGGGGGIFILELDPETGRPLYPGEDSVTEAGNPVDRYFGTRIAAGYMKYGEGSYVIYDEETGYYYLFVSYGMITPDGGYNIRQFRSTNPDGPYLDAKGQNAAIGPDVVTNEGYGIKMMGNYQFSSIATGYKSAGHNSAFIDDDGQRYLVYHQRFASGSNHQVRVHQMFPNEDGWLVEAPYEYSGDTISETGYPKEEVVGYYEFINHGSINSGDMLSTMSIRLNDDYTVSGDVEGTWSMTEGKPYMRITINGVTYKGVFFKQQDESNYDSKVMTFAAIGENNESIWGSRTPLNDNDEKTVLTVLNQLSIPSRTNSDLTLPVKGDYGTTISWTSSNPDVISPDGIITRGAEDASAVVTAVVTKGDAVVAKSFNVRVLAESDEDEEYDLMPLYRYGFGYVDGYLTKATGSRVRGVFGPMATLVGDAKVVVDDEKGKAVLYTSNSGGEEANYLKLPAGSLKGITGGFTISMWVKKTDQQEGILFKAAGNGFTVEIDSALSARISGNGVQAEAVAPGALIENQWQLVTLSAGKNGIALYVEGSKVAEDIKDLSACFAGGIPDNLDIRVGSCDGSAYLDNVEIHGRAYTTPEVEALYNPENSWTTDWNIDFGPEGSPLVAGYTHITNEVVYNKVGILQSYGFDRVISAHETAEGGNWFRDFVYVPGGGEYTFFMDIPNGIYRVSVYTGAKNSANTTYFRFQDDPRVYVHETPEGVGSDNHPGAQYNYNVTVRNHQLKITLWGDQSLGEDAITGRLNGLLIQKIGNIDPFIERIDPIDVKTKVGEAPALPETVKAIYSNYTKRDVNVEWDSIDPSKYAQVGSFTVEGTVEGTDIKAIANVIVTDLVLSIDKPVIERTKTAQLSLQEKLADGELIDIDIAEANVQFMSMNPAIASVDENGVVTGNKVGNTEILVAAVIDGVVYNTDIAVTVEELVMDEVEGFGLEFDPSIVEVGEEVVVTITANEAVDLAAFVARLTYDSELLELKEIIFNESFDFTDNTNADGEIVVLGTLIEDKPGLTGDVELAKVVFTAKDKDAIASITLLPGAQISDTAGALYTQVESIVGEVAVANSDITGGGTAINDLVLVAKAFGAVAGEEGYDAALDMNKDGVIDIVDIAYVASRILNK